VIGVGGTSQFTATASGVNMGNFVYQWTKSGDINLPYKVSGVNEAILTIPYLVESDGGVYYCTVTNQWGNSVRSDYVNLTVIGMYAVLLCVCRGGGWGHVTCVTKYFIHIIIVDRQRCLSQSMHSRKSNHYKAIQIAH